MPRIHELKISAFVAKKFLQNLRETIPQNIYENAVSFQCLYKN
jgi:hypothetical protein